ncbi:uncharacterized protein tp53i13 isoform X2 [Mustelus asterias]
MGLGVGLLLLLCLPLSELGTRWTPCDNGKINLQMDLPPAEHFLCPGSTWPLPERVTPSVAKVYPEQEAAGVCMAKQIEYSQQIPNSGMYRPAWASYGEYLYVPPQRWVHNLQRGGIAFLYHPCVHPRLKEELSLLARACMYKHIITPHLNLSRQWPLALVAWGNSLEMSKVNLAEAVTWLRENVKRASNSEMRDDGAYDYLLIWKAKLLSTSTDRVTCPENQVKELQRHFRKSELQSAMGKWNKVGVSRISKGLSRRRRRNSGIRDLPQSSRKVEGATSFSRSPVQKRDEGSAENASLVHAEVVRSQPNVPAAIAHDPKKGMASGTRENQEGDSEIGGERGGKRDGLGSTFSKEVTTPTLKELPVSEAHPQGLAGSADKQLKMDDLTNSLPRQQTHNASDSSLDSQVKAQRANSEDNSSIKSGESISGKATNQMAVNPAIKEQQIVKIITDINHVADSQGLTGDTSQILQNGKKLSGKNVKVPQPVHPSEISSKNDIGPQKNEDRETGRDKTVQKVKVEETNTSKANETMTPNARDAENETAAVDSGSVKCKCEDGATQLVSNGADSNNLKAGGALGKSQHRVEDRMLYIPTPRTEEAAWAAAALAFLFVFLTLAVLYTRLYRKFIKSDSLYWAPVPSTDWQENVAGRRHKEETQQVWQEEEEKATT